ncbi:terminase small subunit [Mucilaginibacter sp. 10I4]|uniref:terminase small subunit n=1 Tax=Mucilaginibacter sp. 10I4 TaxID=3048580 RepID=UPI002B22B5C2|nr:terminase small subunit [Mucilaginibacter sp. 10I4]MEB0262913.1 terminase small subunit [Mucilaginibacter sp. 10I4]
MATEKAISTHQELWELFTAYKTEVKSNPRHVYVLAQKFGEMVKQPCEVPLTKEGFYNYCANKEIISTLKDYFSNRDSRYSEYVPICTRILDEIRQDQIEGGMVGQYNPSITQRLNGLADKQEIRSEVKTVHKIGYGSKQD